jgi:hypothetical protein
MAEQKQKGQSGKEFCASRFNELCTEEQENIVAALFLKYEDQEGLMWGTFKEDKEKQKELMWIDLCEFHVRSKRVLHQKLKDKIRKLRMRRGVKT